MNCTKTQDGKIKWVWKIKRFLKEEMKVSIQSFKMLLIYCSSHNANDPMF